MLALSTALYLLYFLLHLHQLVFIRTYVCCIYCETAS